MFHQNDIFHTSLGFDMRVPDFCVASPQQMYSEALEMIAYADKSGIDKVDFQEHHQSPDGYNPQPFMLACAAAARTHKIALVMGAVILPFHDPVLVAEQIAVGDLISGGRMYTILAAGYSPTEFAAFRVSLKDRARLMEEGFDIILRALSGERFMEKDREVFVRPLPSRDPREIVYAGGGSPAAAQRAARFGLSMWPMNDDIIQPYEEECRKLGKEPGRLMRGSRSVYITDDPDRGWNEVGPHVLHYVRSYAAWSESEASKSPLHGMDTLEKVRAAGLISVVTPDEAVDIGMNNAIVVQPLMAGLNPELGWKCLELYVNNVLPRIKDAPANWRKAQA